MHFADKVVWITGASSGIGEALAKALARRGARLILSARRHDALARVQALIGAERAAVLPFDVTDLDALPAIATEARALFGRIDLLINNAGISQRSLALETDMSVYRRVMEVDFFAPVALTKAVLPIMIAQGEGHVAVTSSVAGKVGAQMRTGYCAAKHAVMGWFDALRAELAAHNIAVTTIVPGFIRTDISVHALKGDGTPFGALSEAIAGGMDVDRAAETILRGFERGRPEIAVGHGLEMHALWLKRLAPRLVFRLAARTRAE